MPRLIEGAKLCLYLATIALVVLLSGLVWSAHVAVVAIQADAHAVTVSAQALSTKTALDLDEAHRLILEAGLTAMEARKASAKESAYLDRWNVGVEQTLNSASSTLLALKGAAEGITASQAAIALQTVSTLQETQATIKGLQPVEANLSALINDVRQSNTDLDNLVANPDLAKSLENLQVTTKAVSGMATDTQEAWHAYLHPKWPQRIWGYVTGIGLDAAKVFIP